MKSPEYVATVTNIYRKYIDLALSNNDYIIQDEDIKKLMQVDVYKRQLYIFTFYSYHFKF